MRFNVITPSGLHDRPVTATSARQARKIVTDAGFDVVSVVLATALFKRRTVVVTDESYDSVQERKAGCFR